MAHLDFRSPFAHQHITPQEESDPFRAQAEKLLREVTEELGLVEPDVMVFGDSVTTKPTLVYDKFGAHRR